MYYYLTKSNKTQYMDLKKSYQREEEMPWDKKDLYYFLSQPEGLEQWFCDQAEEIDKQHLCLYWNDKPHTAKIVGKKKNKSIKYEFLPDADEETKGQNPYIEYTINKGGLDDTYYLKIVDYSKNMDIAALEQLWDELCYLLRIAIENRWNGPLGIPA